MGTFANTSRHLAGQYIINFLQMPEHALAHLPGLDLAQFELKCLNNVQLLHWGLAVPEQCGLTVVILETWASLPNFCPLDLLGIADKTRFRSGFLHRVTVERGGRVRHAAPV